MTHIRSIVGEAIARMEDRDRVRRLTPYVVQAADMCGVFDEAHSADFEGMVAAAQLFVERYHGRRVVVVRGCNDALVDLDFDGLTEEENAALYEAINLAEARTGLASVRANLPETTVAYR